MARREIPSLGDPNLIPIMAIMSILIPILLYSFVFFEVKVQDISLPARGGRGSGGDDAMQLSLAVLVTRDGFVVEKRYGPGDDQVETKEINKVPYKRCDNDATPCEACEGEEYLEYDYAGLYNKIREYKDQEGFRDQYSITISAQSSIPWRVIAGTIDAVRSKMDKERFEGENPICEYKRGVILRDAGQKVVVVDEAPQQGEEEQAEKPKEDPPVPMFPKILFGDPKADEQVIR